ncbi:MAG: uracil-DNA glycosylase family protein [bacterium]
MARKPKQFRKKKVNYIDFLKALTRWLCGNQRNEDKLEKLINTYDLNNQKLFLRIASYAYNNPHIIWYLNKYFNSLYDFYSYDTKELVYNICYVFDMNMHNKNSNFFYLKSQELRDNNKQKVKKVLKDYFIQIKKKHINDIELNHLYNLFNKGVIKEEDLEKINKTINGEESKLNLDPIEIEETSDNKNLEYSKEQINQYIEECRTRNLSNEISEFCTKLKEIKQKREKCKNCKLFNSEMVVLDTNRETFGEVDFAFVALNPGKTEKIYDKPLVGAAGKLQREMMFYLPKDTKWMITNIMLCFTANQADIGKTEKEISKVSENCRDFLVKIFEKFPAKYYIPIGKPAAAVFGISGSIIENSGQLFEVGNSKIIPLVHPSGVIQYHGKLEQAYKYGFNRIYEIAENIYPNQKNSVNLNVSTENNNSSYQSNKQTTTNKRSNKGYLKNIPEEKIINIDDDKFFEENNITLFDCVNLDNKNILMIYLDQNGIKYYAIKELVVPLYIKTEGNCEILIDDPDAVTYANGYSRNKILKGLRENMEVNKRTAVEK